MPSADAKAVKEPSGDLSRTHRFSNDAASSSDEAANFKQIGTQHDGGSLLDLDQKFFRTACNLVGYVFRIKTKEGKTFEGIFETFNANFDVALSLVHEIVDGLEDALPHDGAVKEKVIFSRETIVTMTTVTEAETFSNKKGFATDQEISRTLNGESNVKVLQVWEPDSHADEDDDHFFDAEHTKDGWAVEEMFEKNKTFGVVSTYEADLSQFSNVQVDGDETSAEYRAKAAEAERLAQQIQANPASQKASLLENDDEERDIVLAAAGSHKNPGTVTSPSSATTEGGQHSSGAGRPSMTFKSTKMAAMGDGTSSENSGKYIPPNKRNMAGGANKRFAKPSGPFSRQQGPSSINNNSNAAPPMASRGGETSPVTSIPYSNKVAGTVASPRFTQQQQPPQSPAAPASISATSPPHYVSAPSTAAAPHDRSPVQTNINNERRTGAPGNQSYANSANMDNKRDSVNAGQHYTTYNNTKQYGQQQTSGNDQQRKQFVGKSHQKEKLADFRKFSNEFQLVEAQQARMTSPPGNRQSPPHYQRSPPKNQSPQTPKGSHGHFPSGKGHPPSSGGKHYSGAASSTAPLAPRHQQQQQQQSSSRPTNLTSSSTMTPVNQIDESSSSPMKPNQQFSQANVVKQRCVVDQSTITTTTILNSSTATSMTNSSPPTPSAQTATMAGGMAVYQQQQNNQSPTDEGFDEPSKEMTDSTIRKSKLNPDAKEFCPSMQFFRPTPVQTPVAAAANFYALGAAAASSLQSPVGQQAPPMPPQLVANYSAAAAAAAMMTSAPPPPQQPPMQPPTPQQSTSPQLSQTPGPPMAPQIPQAVIYGAPQFQQPPPAAGGQNVPPPPISTFSTMTLLPSGTPIYTINQPAVAYLHSNNGAQAAAAAAVAAYRPMKAAGQPAGAMAATGQPIMTAPSLAANASYFVPYPAPAAAAGGAPQGAAAAAHQIYPQTQYVISTAAPRMQMQYHIVPQMAAGPPTDNGQNQQIYVAQQTNAAMQQQQHHVAAAAANAGNNGNGHAAAIASQSQQPMVAASPYVFQYAAGGHPTALAYPSGQVVFSAPRMQYAVLPQAAGADGTQQPVYVTSFPHAAAYPHLMRSASLTGNGAIYGQQPQQMCQQQSTNGNNGTPANA